MTNDQLINQNSGKTEYGTPPDIIERVRRTMGGIDLDPASSEVFNENVKALKYFNLQGLLVLWWGNVWLNHPYGREANRLWIEKIVTEYESGRVKQACCITFASTSEKWFRPLLKYPQCFIYGRVKFLGEDGKPVGTATKGSVVTYFGPKPNLFQLNFVEIGAVKKLFAALKEQEAKMIYNLTQKHIDNGSPGMCSECPVALCLLEHYDYVLVTNDTGIVVWMEGRDGEIYQTPDIVDEFIRKFDRSGGRNKNLNSFSFELPKEFEVYTDPESLT